MCQRVNTKIHSRSIHIYWVRLKQAIPYEIGMGDDENGFGDFWNKTITAMRLFNNKLYVSTGLNYEYGGQIWYTENGDDWTVTPR